MFLWLICCALGSWYISAMDQERYSKDPEAMRCMMEHYLHSCLSQEIKDVKAQQKEDFQKLSIPEQKRHILAKTLCKAEIFSEQKYLYLHWDDCPEVQEVIAYDNNDLLIRLNTLYSDLNKERLVAYVFNATTKKTRELYGFPVSYSLMKAYDIKSYFYILRDDASDHKELHIWNIKDLTTKRIHDMGQLNGIVVSNSQLIVQKTHASVFTIYDIDEDCALKLKDEITIDCTVALPQFIIKDRLVTKLLQDYEVYGCFSSYKIGNLQLLQKSEPRLAFPTVESKIASNCKYFHFIQDDLGLAIYPVVDIDELTNDEVEQGLSYWRACGERDALHAKLVDMLFARKDIEIADEGHIFILNPKKLIENYNDRIKINLIAENEK